MKAQRAPLLAFLLASALALPVTAASDPTYKYRDEDGTVWFTDRPATGADFDRMEFLGYQGRPPAQHGCGSMDDEALAQRAQRIETPLTEYTQRFEVDYELARAIITVESCFDPDAVSRVGAQGLMQLMPDTARTLGVEDSFDIHQNLQGGLAYFQQLQQRYGGDPVRALAAYNAGPSAVDRYEGIPPFPETERYVDRVLDYWSQYRNAAVD